MSDPSSINKLAKRKNISASAKRELAKYNLNIQVGDIFIDYSSREGDLFRISKITKTKVDYDHQWGGEWHFYGSSTIEEFAKKAYIKIDKPIEQVEEEMLDRVKNLDQFLEDSRQENAETTALAQTDSKEHLTRCESILEKKFNEFALMRAVLDRKRGELCCYMHDLQEQMVGVRKVLGVIELYMGIHEEIIQIKEGDSAPIDSPIYIRQQLLYMDEEIGDPTDGGLDFQKLEDFDDWLLDSEHLDQILPEQKGVVALRVRRHDKNYIGVHPFVASEMNTQNAMTYLLIRNGQNLYRIWSNVTVNPRLFPKRNEFKPKKHVFADGREWESPFSDKEIRESEFEYKKYGLMIQGLLHRTEVFHPIDTQIDIFKPETWNNRLIFVRDDEMLLSSGRLPWKKWQEEINSKIQVGSRIVFALPPDVWAYRDYMCGRVTYYLRCVDKPPTGLYTVVPGPKGETDEENLRFLYLPGDKVWHEWTCNDSGGLRPRKNRVGFRFYNSEVLNYDQISLDDIEFYLGSRVDRHDYVSMISLLWKLKKQRRAELEREKHFVKLVVQRNDVEEKVVWDAVKWWKYKNKWKRPLEQDDAKALRMIERRIRSEVNKNLDGLENECH